MSADPVRRRAVEVLLAAAAGRDLQPLLDTALASLAEDRQRSFLAELVKGTLRWQARYDQIIRRLSRRRFPRDQQLLQLLRVSLHQLIGCQGVAPYAAVHQAGELCRAMISARQVPYVNGLMQALSRQLAASGQPAEEAILPFFPDPVRDAVGFLSAYHSHPSWLVQRWLSRYGRADCEALCRHNNQPPPLTLHVLPPADPARSAADLAAAGIQSAPGRHHPRALVVAERLDRVKLRDLLQRRPELIVQDEGAQEVCHWLAAGLHGRMLDLCAAPGGKAFHFRAIWPAGDDVIAMDRRPERLALLRQTAKRIEDDRLLVVLADGMAAPFAAGRFAAVLLDGPCSGTGVMRHHPEGRWRLQAADLQRCAAQLQSLAQQAAALLIPGGRLLYSTCSLEPEENEQVLAELLASDSGLAPEVSPVDPARWQRTWLPHRDQTDGFFAARLRKKVS